MGRHRCWGLGKLVGRSVAEREARHASQRSANLNLSSGYAAIDALVALLVLTLAIVASLNGVAQARRLSSAALQKRQAQLLAGQLLAATPLPTAPGHFSGQTRDFVWTLDVHEPVRTYGAGALCERRIRIVGAATRRVYETASAEICSDKNHEPLEGG